MSQTYCFSIQKRSSYSARDAMSVPAAYAHNTRTYINGQLPENIDGNLTHLNRTLVELPKGEDYSTLCKKAEKASRKITGTKVRSDAVRALTFVCNYQGTDMSPEQVYEWANDSLKWIRETFGENNVKHAVLHMDEPNTSPHLHVMSIPIDERGHLCCGNILKETYHTLQNKYYESVAKKYGFSRGVPFKRRNPDLNTIAKYKQATIMRNLISEEELSPKPEELDSNGHLLYKKDDDEREWCPYLERFKKDIQDMKWQQSKKEMDTQNRYDEYFASAAHTRYEAEKDVEREREKYYRKEKALEEEYLKKEQELKKEYKEKEQTLMNEQKSALANLELFQSFLREGEDYVHLAKRFKGFKLLDAALSKPENEQLKELVNKAISRERSIEKEQNAVKS